MPKILLTGGKGFIGTNLYTELSRRGHDVYTCDIAHSESGNHIRCDIGSFWQLARIFDEHRFDYVYHMAAEHGRCNGEDYYESLWVTNAIGTKNVLRLQERHGFRLVYFSSAGVYGDYGGLMREDVTEKMPLLQMNDNAIVKRAGEMQVMNSARMFGTESVRVRLANTYGPHEYYSPYRGAIPIFVYRALMDRPYIVYTGHYRIFDYVEDTCRTLGNIVDNFIPGEVYNIGGHEDWLTDIKHVSDLVLSCLGKNDSLVTYKDVEPFVIKTKRMDFSKSRAHLGHAPKIPLEVGIPKYIDWIKQKYLGSKSGAVHTMEKILSPF
ncbi:MAG: NAD(P)-dependent oxidoreductase [Nitrospiraceae bacterium]|nr:NAD(P)-dependent oxidoreductase [Nitrospiraceae bacterium]